SVEAREDVRLGEFAKQIEVRLKLETERILDLAKTIEENQDTIKLKPCKVELLGTGLPKDRCGLWQGLEQLNPPTTDKRTIQPGSLELDVVVWLDSDGNQIQKWSTKQQVTGPASHRSFDHFRDLSYQHTWTLAGRDN